jgi:hypothetical protein
MLLVVLFSYVLVAIRPKASKKSAIFVALATKVRLLERLELLSILKLQKL